MKIFSGRKAGKCRSEQFDALVRPHIPDLYRLAFKMTSSRMDAEDLVQDVLARLFTRMSELRKVADLRPWLMRVLYNQFIDHCRKQRRDPLLGGVSFEKVSPDDSMDFMTAPDPEPEQAAYSASQSKRVLAALDNLDSQKRALVVLHMMEGHTLDELTNVFNVPLGTIKSRLQRAKAQLKGQLCVEPSALRLRDRDKVS